MSELLEDQETEETVQDEVDLGELGQVLPDEDEEDFDATPERVEVPPAPNVSDQEAAAWRQVSQLYESNPAFREHFDNAMAAATGQPSRTQPVPAEDEFDLSYLDDDTRRYIESVKAQAEQAATLAQAAVANQGEAVFASWMGEIESRYGQIDDATKGELRRRSEQWLTPQAYQFARATGENPLEGLLFQVKRDVILSGVKDRAARRGAQVGAKTSSRTPKASGTERVEKQPEDMTPDELSNYTLEIFRQKMAEAQPDL